MTDLTNLPDPELTAGIKPVYTLCGISEQPSIYKDGEYCGYIKPRELGQKVVDLLNAAPEPKLDIADTVEEAPDDWILDTTERLEAVEAAHITATDMFDGLKDICKDLHQRLEKSNSLARSQQSEIKSMNTRINTNRNRSSTIEAKLEAYGRRVKSRTEVESNDTIAS